MKKLLLAIVLFSLLFIGCVRQEEMGTSKHSYDKYTIEMVAYSKIHGMAIYETTIDGDRYLIFRAGNSGIVVIKK